MSISPEIITYQHVYNEHRQTIPPNLQSFLPTSCFGVVSHESQHPTIASSFKVSTIPLHVIIISV